MKDVQSERERQPSKTQPEPSSDLKVCCFVLIKTNCSVKTPKQRTRFIRCWEIKYIS